MLLLRLSLRERHASSAETSASTSDRLLAKEAGDMNTPNRPSAESAGIHFPPPFLYVGFLLVGLLLERWAPLLTLPRTPSRVLAAPLLLAGLGTIFWSLLLFLRARTNPLPMRPATALVRSGPYRWTRNPMYLGMLLLYLGVAFLFDLFWPLILAPLVVLAVNRLVI
jgi:protein-S-isoprenylcysteine O-methyltransferase Ste14